MPEYATHRRGYLVVTDRVTGRQQETDTYTCGHCNAQTEVGPGVSPANLGGHCKICWALTCPRCTQQGSCIPFELKLQRIEQRGQTLRSLGL